MILMYHAYRIVYMTNIDMNPVLHPVPSFKLQHVTHSAVMVISIQHIIEHSHLRYIIWWLLHMESNS